MAMRLHDVHLLENQYLQLQYMLLFKGPAHSGLVFLTTFLRTAVRLKVGRALLGRRANKEEEGVYWNCQSNPLCTSPCSPAKGSNTETPTDCIHKVKIKHISHLT